MCPIANSIVPIKKNKPNLSQLTVANIPITAQIIEIAMVIIAKNINISDIKCKIVLIISKILQKVN